MARALVIFDFDGPLADSFVESLATYNRVAPRFRLRTVPGDEVASLRRLTVGQLMTTLGVPMWKLPRLMIAVRAFLDPLLAHPSERTWRPSAWQREDSNHSR